MMGMAPASMIITAAVEDMPSVAIAKRDRLLSL
jgi:hypothetical protein